MRKISKYIEEKVSSNNWQDKEHPNGVSRKRTVSFSRRLSRFGYYFNRDVTLDLIRRHKISLSIFCVLIMLTVGWFGYVSKLFEKKDGEDSPGPVFASQPVYHNNKIVKINSDLIIDSLYQLDNTTLEINASMDGELKIEVRENGNLRLLNNSKITWSDQDKYYNFVVLPHATLYCDNSTIERMWDDSGDGSNGLNIQSNETTIKYSIITDCYGNGISIVQSSPTITNTNISGNYLCGIEITGSSEYVAEPVIRNCVIANNFASGIAIQNYSNPYIIGNTIKDNDNEGVKVYSSIFTEERITTFSSGYDSEVLFFENTGDYNTEISLPLISGVDITNASFNISKGSNFDKVGMETWTVSTETQLNGGSFDNCTHSSSYDGIVLSENSSSESENLAFYAPFDTNYTARSAHGSPDPAYSSMWNVTGYSGNAIYPINTSAYLSYSTENNIFVDNGTISFYVKPLWSSSGKYYIFTTSDETDEYACTDLESISIYVDSDKFYFRINGDSAIDSSTLSAGFSVSSWSKYIWYEVKCTWGNINGNHDNSFAKVYVDDELKASAYGTLDISSLYGTMHIGSVKGASNQARAHIDEFRIFNKSFSHYNIENDRDSIIDHMETGTYTSKVYTTSQLVNYGDMSWSEVLPFNSSVTVQTRSANDSSIDWSGWSDALAMSSGSEITSPPGKYFQFRMNLTADDITETPVVTDIVITYSYNNYTIYSERDTFEKGDQGSSDIYASPGSILAEGDELSNNATTRFLLDLNSGLTAEGDGSHDPVLNHCTGSVGGKLFNGTYVDESTILAYTWASSFYRNEGTLEFRVRPDWTSGDERDHYLFAITDDHSSLAYLAQDSFVVGVTDDSETLRVGINDNSTNTSRYHQHEIDISWKEDTWYFVTVTWKSINSGTNNSWSKVYIDGELKSSESELQTNLGSMNSSMFIGQLPYGAHPAVATFDEMRILDTPLDLSQIDDDHECYHTSSSYISRILDIEEDRYWPRVAWEEALPTGTSIEIQIRTSEDNITWSAWSEEVSISSGSSFDCAAGRYMQYKAYLNTTNQANTPELGETRFIHTKYPALVDSTFEDGTSDGVTIYDDDHIELKTREFVADGNTLLLAHYNGDKDADHAEGSSIASGGGLEFETGKLFQSVVIHEENSGYLSYQTTDNFDKDMGTLECWCKPDWSTSGEPSDRYLFSLSSGNTTDTYDEADSYTIFTSNSCSELNFYITSDAPQGAGNHHLTANIDWEEGTWYHIACTWSGINGGANAADSNLYIDGSLKASTSGKTTAVSSIYSNMYIGHVRQNRYRFNGCIDELLISDAEKNGATIASDRESQLQLYDNSGTFVSNEYEMPYPGCYNSICWDATGTSTDAVARFQVRTAPSEGGLSTATWKGPSSPGDHFTFSGEEMYYDQDHDWIQYKLYLSSGTGNNTPTVKEVRFLNERLIKGINIDIGDNGDTEWSYDMFRDDFEGDVLDSMWTEDMYSGTGGDIEPDGNGYVEADSYGSKVADNWFGPNITADTVKADGSFSIEIRFDCENDQTSMGRMYIDLLDESYNLLFRCIWSDEEAGYDLSGIKLQDDTGDIYTYTRTPTYNDFNGRLKVERIGNTQVKFYADIGNGYVEKTLNSTPSASSLNGIVAKIHVAMLKNDGNTELTENKLNWISFSHYNEMLPEIVSGGTVIDEIERELPDRMGSSLNIPLNITSTSGHVKLYNLNITYMGINRFRDNLIDGNYIGLEVDYGNIMCYRNVIINNTIGIVSALNSSPLIYECDIVNSQTTMIISNNSNVAMVETTFPSSGVDVYDGSSMEVYYFFNTSIRNATTDSAVSGARLKIYELRDGLSDSLIYDNYSDSNGYVPEELLLSYMQNSSDCFFTQYKVTITNSDDDSNLFYIVPDFNTSYNVYTDGDSDCDLIADTIESNQEIMWFEAEAHVEYDEEQILSDLMASGQHVAVRREVTTAPIIDDIFPVSGTGPYKCFFKARADCSESTPAYISAEIWDGDSLLIVQSFYVNDRYRWFGIDDFALGNESFRLSLRDDNPEQCIYLDALMVLNLSSRTEGQVSNPLNMDTDGDMLFDGLELRENTYWFEAEEYINTSEKLCLDVKAYNGSAAQNNWTGRGIINTSIDLVSGQYLIYIRAKDSNPYPWGTSPVIEVELGDFTEEFYFPTRYQWKKTEIFDIETNGSYNISFSDVSSLGTYPKKVDKFAIVRIDDIYNDNLYMNDQPYKELTISRQDFRENGDNYSYELQFPGDAYVTNATMTVNYTALVHNFTYAPNQTRPSVWEDFVVWEEYNFTYGRDVIWMYNFSVDTDSDGIPNYIDETDTGFPSGDKYNLNNDNDWFLDLNGIVGFQPYSEDEVWQDTNNNGIFDSGDTCLYSGLDQVACSNYFLNYYGELYDEEIYGNNYDDDGDGSTDEDYRDPALHLIINNSRDCERPRIHDNLIVWFNESLIGGYDVSIYETL